MRDNDAICDPSIEEHFLGNILRSPERLGEILTDITLIPDVFYLPRTRAVYQQILHLYEQGITPEVEQVQSRLNGACPDSYAHALVETKYAIDLRSYAERLVELYQWRRRREASIQALEAISRQDLESYSRARAIDEGNLLSQNSYYPPERLASDFREYVKTDSIEAFKLPFQKLNQCLGGGLRRKQFTVLGGWTSHGKSVIIDQLLSYTAREGNNVHLYMNEMGHEERVARLLASDTEINLQKILSNRLTTGQKEKVDTALNNLPFSITPCAGWSISELTFDIRSKQYDVIGIDILHQFDYDSEIQLAHISRLLSRVAKQANCHVIATVHLNEFRAQGPVLPRPVKRDIRGSGMLQRDPDNILFIHREQDPYTGDPLCSSTFYTSKVRNGSLGHVELNFNPISMKFEEDQQWE